MSQPLTIIIVEKTGILKLLTIKDFKLEELYKKCGFKKGDDFLKQTEWKIKMDGNKYLIEVYAKNDGRTNSENKYDFPPPIDTKLFFGNCALIAYLKKDNDINQPIDLSIHLWNKMYEKLFGGFEDLVTSALEDEKEIDELANIPKNKKTKQGYLKDGFVVDSSDTEESDSISINDNVEPLSEEDENIDEEEDLGSELSEESYEYDSETIEK